MLNLKSFAPFCDCIQLNNPSLVTEIANLLYLFHPCLLAIISSPLSHFSRCRSWGEYDIVRNQKEYKYPPGDRIIYNELTRSILKTLS